MLFIKEGDNYGYVMNVTLYILGLLRQLGNLLLLVCKQGYIIN